MNFPQPNVFRVTMALNVSQDNLTERFLTTALGKKKKKLFMNDITRVISLFTVLDTCTLKYWVVVNPAIHDENDGNEYVRKQNAVQSFYTCAINNNGKWPNSANFLCKIKSASAKNPSEIKEQTERKLYFRNHDIIVLKGSLLLKSGCDFCC